MRKTHFRNKRRSSDSEMAGQRRPIGTYRTASIEWKLAVIARMDELDLSRAEMSRRLRAITGTGTAQALSNLLGREGAAPVASSTKLMPVIHRVLGWKPPPGDDKPEKSDDDLRDGIINAWPDLDTTDRAIIAAIVAKRTRGA